MFRSASDLYNLYNQVLEAAQNQELWERSHTKPGENRIKNDIRCSAPLRICIIKLWKPHKTRNCGKEAVQNQERIESRMISDVPLRLLSELWKPHKTRSCGKEAVQNQERIELRMISDVPLRFGFVLSELWKPNKTRSCGKGATQNHANCSCTNVKMKSDVPLRFGFT